MSLIKKILPIFLLLFIFVSCNNKTEILNDSFFCSAEKTYKDSILVADDNSEIFLSGIGLLSADYAKTGEFSLKLDSARQFAFSTHQLLHPETIYELSFWQYGNNSNVVAIVQQDTNLYMKSANIAQDSSDGWYKKSIVFSIPNELKDKKIQLYIWNVGKKEVFIDDFSLSLYDIDNLGVADTLFWIYLDDKEYETIIVNRDLALQQGVLTTNDDSWVKGMVIWADDTYKVKMRLKGDWLDHLAGKKWSFRVKIRKDKAYKGMKVFSIQNPATRNFLNQWFLYTLFRSEDLLAPRYGFIYGQLNNDFLGLYAYEEHFQKQLIESQKRREGPILKFSEESFWDKMLAHKKFDKWYNYPLYEASKIEPFSEGKTLSNVTLTAGFNIAKNLVYQHKWGLGKVSDIFDVKKAAQFFALTNVMQGYHGFRWHNQRYYYNPITSKLEFVVYDNYVGEGLFDLSDEPIFGNFDLDNSGKNPENISYYYFFKDSVFVQDYINYLQKYSQKSFWDSVFVQYNDEIVYYQTLLLREFDNSMFSQNLFYNHAEKIRADLPAYINRVNNGMYDSLILPHRDASFYTKIANSYFIENYVNIYTQSTTDDSLTLRAVSFYAQDLKIIKYGTDNRQYSMSQITLNSFSSNNKIDFKIAADVEFIVVTDDTIEVQIPILKWSEPNTWTPRQELFAQNAFPYQEYYSMINDTVVFSGKHTCNEIILIPENYHVVFRAGTEIDFVNNGGFLSYSPVYINGKETKKVKISSSDNTAIGFSVLQAGKVEMSYAIFDGLNTLNYKGWGLTGAVSIYQSSTTITNCDFINNVCEDDLNIISSNFSVTNSLFKNTFSDAFDSDFCTGLVDNCTFIDLGNDAIDFSTSEIDISNCTILNAGDKAISGGEASHLKITNCQIDQAVIAIASKDNSVLKISNVDIENVEYVMAAFMKKPEYGSAKIIANNINAGNYVQISLIEINSLLILDNLPIEGTHADVAKKFY